MKSNVLYKVEFEWNKQIRFGVGYAYNLNKDERPHIGISLPDGGVMNVAADEVIKITPIAFFDGQTINTK